MLTLEKFLISIERKAFRIAQLSVKNEADALDIVQDSMLKLAQKYGHWQDEGKTEQWPPVFYKILHNRILDFHRKRNREGSKFFRSLFGNKLDSDEAFYENQSIDYGPEEEAVFEQTGAKALLAIENLPFMQQQCVILRSWEGFSVRDTADILDVSEGSIKTHHFRALKKLKEALYE